MKSASVVSAAAEMAQSPIPECDSYREGLDKLVAGINNCPIVTAKGRLSIERQAIGHLANRFAVESYISRHPALLDVGVQRPVFVLGAPRTGTTLMVNLLNQDADARTLLKWEINSPVPPSRAGELLTDSRVINMNETRRLEVKEGKLKTNIHFEWFNEPTECVYIMMQDFKSTAWDAFLPMPAYSEFLLTANMEPTYRWHKRVLQHLQQNNTGRWTLKAPGHALFAKDLLKVYPDARIIWMHRDPATIVASHASQNAEIHRRFAERADVDYIADFYPRQLAEHVNRMLDVEAAYPHQVFNVLYEDLVRHPVETIDKLYSEMSMKLSQKTRASVLHRVAEHPRGVGGQHDYLAGKLSTDDGRVNRLFARYRERLSNISAVVSGEVK